MQLAYLLTTHKDPEQLSPLLAALSHRDNLYAVHCDRKSGRRFQRSVAAAFQSLHVDAVSFLPSRCCTWAGFSQTQVTLDGIAALLAHPEWEYFINLSGQCFPLRSQTFVREQLTRADGATFMQVIPIRTEWADAVERITTYRLEAPALSRVFNTRIPRRYLDATTPYGGSSWFVLSRSFCEWIVGSDQAKAIIDWHRYAHHADELLFQTLLMHSPFAPSVVRDNKRFMKWLPGRAHPELLLMDDLRRAVSSGAWFARKLDAAVSAQALLECQLREP